MAITSTQRQQITSASTAAVLGDQSNAETGVVLIGTASADTLSGFAGNDTLTAGGGNDTLDGGAGRDTAVFSGNWADYLITRNADGSYTTSDQRASAQADGSDTLIGIERLRFSDKSVALDLDGNAGTAAKILAAVFGAPSLSNPQYAGIAIDLLDQGMSMESLTSLALTARLGTGYSNDAEIKLLYQNLLGVAPTQSDLADWSGLITSQGYTQASLAAAAAGSLVNLINIHRTGVANTGLEYLPTTTVANVNHAPVAVNDMASTNEDATVSGNVLTLASGGADTDADGDTLTVSTTGSFATTLGGSVTLSANGAFTYDPRGSATLQAMNTGTSKVDGFSYSISDGHGGTSSAQVAVTVAGRNEASVSTAGLAPSVEADTPLRYYLRYTDAGNASKWLEVGSFDVGLESATFFGGRTGVTVGNASAGEFVTALGSSQAVSVFTERLLQGKFLDSVEVEAYTPGAGGPQVVQEYKFGGVYVTGVQTSGSGLATSNSLSFTSETFGQSVSPLDGKGVPKAPVTNGFDFSRHVIDTNSAVLPHTGADARVNDLGRQVSVDAPLDYYVRIEGISGISGWLPLSGMNMGLEASTSVGTGEATSVGKAVLSEVALELGASAAVTKLLGSLFAGTAVNTIEVEAYSRSATGKQLVDEYIFSDAYVTGLQSEDVSSNTLNFVYQQFTHGHQTYKDTGARDVVSGVGYDVERATTIGVNSPAPGAVSSAGSSAGLAPSVEADQPLRYYLRYTDAGQASKWLEVGSFDVGFESAASIGRTGVTVGRASPGEFVTALGSSQAVSVFTEKLLQGKFLDSVEVEAYTPGAGGRQVVQEYKFGAVYVTGVQTSGSGLATSNSLSFTSETFGQSVSPLDGKGVPKAPVTNGFDFSGYVTSSAALPHTGADATVNDLGSQVPVDAPLDYYVRIDGISGISGWLPLSGMNMGFEASTSVARDEATSVGKAVVSEVALELGASAAVTQLLGSLFAGTAVNTIEVEAYSRSATGKQLVDEYIFSDAYVTGLQSEDVSSNTLNFVYQRFTHGHQTYKDTGARDVFSGVGYDVERATTIGVNSPVPDAIH